MIKKVVSESIQKALSRLYPDIDIGVEIPKNIDHGDYATNVSFLLAPQLKKKPAEIAAEICTILADNTEFASDLLVTPMNGFVNITLTDELIWREFTTLYSTPFQFNIEKSHYLLEYVSANPTGPLHIGHGRWAVLGDVLARLLKFVGHHVHTEYYINDAGVQIKLFRDSVLAEKSGEEVPDGGYGGVYIQDLANQDEDPLSVMLTMQQAVLTSLGVVFDDWFSELSIHQGGGVGRCISTLRDHGYVYDKDGAVWFESTRFNDDKDRVLIKADGQYTYFAVDIAYHDHKMSRNYDKLINIWGADHHGYVNRVKGAIHAIQNTAAENPLTVIIGQLVTLYRDGEVVRMSKRTGEMITLKEVIDDIGVDATRYFLVQKSHDTHLDFDMDLAALQSSENPVYYIQYAYARICSLFKKLDHLEGCSVPDSAILEEKERRLILFSLRLPDILLDAAQSCSSHRIAVYAWEIARSFHQFYEACPIMSASEDVQIKRYHILTITKQSLLTCLDLLGISAPENM